MNESDQKIILKQTEKAKKIFKDNFIYINNVDDMPKKSGGYLIEKIDKNPKLVFHFLEFLTGQKYVDLEKEKGIIFIDDKVTWEFLFKTDSGFIRVYDWKNYSVSIGSNSGGEIDKELKEKALLLKKIIEENIDNFLDFKKISSKIELNQRPLDNFMKAWYSMELMFKYSQEKIKKENFGFMESLILFVSLIDTMLRYSILMTRINKRKSTKVDQDLLELFFQKDKKYISERDIFKIAEKEVDFKKNNKVDFFKRVNELYDWRNRAVHRYAITNFQYVEIKNVINEYKDLKDILSEIVVSLEKEQVILNIGFLKKDDIAAKSKDQMSKILDEVFETKVNPYIIYKKDPERDSIFSDKFKKGINPKFRKIIEKLK